MSFDSWRDDSDCILGHNKCLLIHGETILIAFCGTSTATYCVTIDVKQTFRETNRQELETKPEEKVTRKPGKKIAGSIFSI